jgi:hypothetical protein
VNQYKVDELMGLMIGVSTSGPEAKLTYIQVADTCFESDNRSYRHAENLSVNHEQTMTKAISI